MGKKLSESEADELILKHDIDGSGVLSFAEFKQIFIESDLELRDIKDLKDSNL